jgi:predicted nucleotidyltransferase
VDAEHLIIDIADRLRSVPGIAAVVLGGSRAAGTFTPQSDIDIGISYDDARRFDLAALRRVAADLDDQHAPDVLTEIGGWGPWINGGGWLTVSGQAVDFLYRDLHRVKHYVDLAIVGQVETVAIWGHPHGFLTTIYAAEIASCQVLWERNGAITALQARLKHYPLALRAHMIQQFSAEAEFFVMVARHGIPRRDGAYFAGCAFRIIACLMQVLFARNERWLMNEKGAVAQASQLPLTLPHLQARVDAIFADLTPDPARLTIGCDALAALVAEVRRITA